MIKRLWDRILDWFCAQKRANRYQRLYEQLHARFELSEQQLEQAVGHVTELAYLHLELEQGDMLRVEKSSYCYACGEPLVEGANFCHECGQRRGRMPVLPQKELREVRI